MIIALWGLALSSTKTKVGSTAAAYNLTMGSRTSFRYRAVIIEPHLKICMPVRYPCSHHDASTSDCAMFSDVPGQLRWPSSLP
ncbi:hypothetical protein CDAR_233031 [Caerostris darwini]|uniref:Secreted protein n=1 Tax=Caerostris darwini TaxID=1538125 RepID=A0AAV4Q706_9ARAC|nr:hypothetical protein CDAR_233031 [Caerostris darwini]